MSDETIKELKPYLVKLDPTQMAYIGPAFSRDILEGEFSIFKEPLTNFQTHFFVVSHDGDVDFSIYFVKLNHLKSEFTCDLAIVLSFGEILKFIESLKKGIKLVEKVKPADKVVNDDNVRAEEDEYQRLGVVIHPKTVFFSPNRYFNYSSRFEHQIIFGRKVGDVKIEDETKVAVLYSHSVTIPHTEIQQLLDIINANISRFEEKHSIKLKSLTLGNTK